jgi:septal ring factor EnvC (AmiA/AmiB activator)
MAHLCREDAARQASESARLRAHAKELEGLLAAARAAARADRDAAAVVERQLLRAREEHDAEVRHLASELAKVRQQVGGCGRAGPGRRGAGGVGWLGRAWPRPSWLLAAELGWAAPGRE